MILSGCAAGLLDFFLEGFIELYPFLLRFIRFDQFFYRVSTGCKLDSIAVLSSFFLAGTTDLFESPAHLSCFTRFLTRVFFSVFVWFLSNSVWVEWMSCWFYTTLTKSFHVLSNTTVLDPVSTRFTGFPSGWLQNAVVESSPSRNVLL